MGSPIGELTPFRGPHKDHPPPGPHSFDQWDLYQEWRYKPMPMTLAESKSLAESVTTLLR